MFHGQPLTAGRQQCAGQFAVHEDGQAGLQFAGAGRLAHAGPGLVGDETASGVGQAQRRAGTRATSLPAPEQRCDAIPTAVGHIVAGQVGGSVLPAAFAGAGVAPELDLRGAPGQQQRSTDADQDDDGKGGHQFPEQATLHWLSRRACNQTCTPRRARL